MRTCSIWVVLSCLSGSLFGGQQPILRLPEPPRQKPAWRLDASVPTNISSAAATLFDQGFPDPRGCEYREIDVAVSIVWDPRSNVAKTRGWVLPAKSTAAERFAICWNGLIYPVANVGAAASVRGELTNPVQWVGRGFNNASGEHQTVFFPNAASTRMLLLLLCGETEVVVKNWAPYPRRDFNARLVPGREGNEDAYLEFASDWAWAMFDRTICAHMRGDEALALATARQLAAVQPKIEAEAARRGFPRQHYFDSWREGKEKPYLDFLEQLPAILADLERRATAGNRAGRPQTGRPGTTNQATRIAALIHGLEFAQAVQWGQPGAVNLVEDARVSALIAEGDAAVEPLLDCLEHDQRLTRSVGFGRDFFRNRTVLPVSNAAKVALQTILQAGFTGGAPEMRAYWAKYKGMSLDERWYAMLKDDSAGGRWLEAAAHITEPENETTFPGGFSRTKPVPTNTPVRLRGESLRAKSDPTVSQLMARRATELPAGNPNAYNLAAACRMGLHLGSWDPQAAAPVAEVLVQRCGAVMRYSDEKLGPYVSKLTLVWAQAGNSRAFVDYAAWLKTTTPEYLASSVPECLEPLWKYPDNAILQATAEILLDNTNSTWSSLPWKGAGLYNPIESELINVGAFRHLLARELDRKTICGSVVWGAQNSASFQVTNYLSGSRSVAFPENQQPPIGTRADLRWCDWIAWTLSNSKQVAFFNPFAPVEKRDEDITSMKAILEQR